MLDFVVCPVCRDGLAIHEMSGDGRDAVLAHDHTDCRERFPAVGGVPRLLVGAARYRFTRERTDWFMTSPLARQFSDWTTLTRESSDLAIVERFDREWGSFSRVGATEQGAIFARYFDVVPKELLAEGRLALDAGCGAGRWAYEVQRHGARVIAVDLGQSIEVAERNTRDTGRVACVQADVRDLPTRADAFDLVYSLGVLHHLQPTEDVVRNLAGGLRPGGALLLYLYYALDDRSALYRGLFRAVDAFRSVSSALPQSILVALSTAIATLVYFPFARLAKILHAAGRHHLADSLPLSFYANLSFETMLNDSLDRFGTRLEKRFTREQVGRLLDRSGFVDVVISPAPPKWHAIGRIPPAN